MLKKQVVKLAAFVITIICFGVSSSSLVAVASKGTASMTISKYESYLSHYSTTTAKNAGVSEKYRSSAVAGARSQLTAFKKLTTAQKKQYIKALGSIGTVQNYSTQRTTSYAFAKKGAKTYSKTVNATCDWKPAKYFPSVLKFRDTVTYQVKGKKVLKTTSSDNYVLSNYNPFVSLKKTGNKRRVSKNKAYTWARWKYVLGVGKYGAHLGNINFSIWGNYKGQLTDYHAWKTS